MNKFLRSKIIQNLPENCTCEDIQYHIFVVENNIREIFIYSYGLICSINDDAVLFVAVVHGRRVLENHEKHNKK